MNLNQVLSLVRGAMLIVGTFLITTDYHQGYVSAADWETLTGATVTIAGIIWAMVVHTDARSIERVKAIPGVRVVNDPR